MKSPPLNSHQLSFSFENLMMKKGRCQIATVDEQKGRILIDPKHLTRVFALSPEGRKTEPLLSSEHNEAVADYINMEILNHL